MCVCVDSRGRKRNVEIFIDSMLEEEKGTWREGKRETGASSFSPRTKTGKKTGGLARR